MFTSAPESMMREPSSSEVLENDRMWKSGDLSCRPGGQARMFRIVSEAPSTELVTAGGPPVEAEVGLTPDDAAADLEG